MRYEAHKENYACVQHIEGKVNEIVTDFIRRLDELLKAKIDRYLNDEFSGRDKRNVGTELPLELNDNDNATALLKGYDQNRTGTDTINSHVNRKPRSTAALWSIVLGISSLVSSAGQALYFGNKMTQIYSFVGDVQSQMNNDAVWIRQVQTNVRILEAKGDAIAARVDAIY